MAKKTGEYIKLKNNPPKKLASGTKLWCKSSTDTITKGKSYRIKNHFCYLNNVNLGNGRKFWVWDEFITIKNDQDYTIKVNLNRFAENISDDPILILQTVNL